MECANAKPTQFWCALPEIFAINCAVIPPNLKSCCYSVFGKQCPQLFKFQGCSSNWLCVFFCKFTYIIINSHLLKNKICHAEMRMSRNFSRWHWLHKIKLSSVFNKPFRRELEFQFSLAVSETTSLS